MFFSKMHGLHNDFLVVDCIRQKNLFFSNELIIKLANRKSGIGFDQLLIVEPSHNINYDFHYRIFNSNGYEVNQCGNGARCITTFVKIKGLTEKNTIKVSTKNGFLICSIKKNNLVCVNMGEPNFNHSDIPFNDMYGKTNNFYLLKIYKNTSILCDVVSLGNPHCIIQVKDIKNYNVKKIGQLIEKHKSFPDHVNVGFVEIINKNKIYLRVYERGVGETQACGSGACAAVAIGIKHNLIKDNVFVHLKGGVLHVSWKGIGFPMFMTGPAVHIYDGNINI